MRALAIFLCILAVIPVVSAIGISPTKATIDFVPYGEGAFDVLLKNNQNFEVGTDVEIKGNLAQYFSAENPDINPRGTAAAEISWALPEDIPPGRHKQIVYFGENYFSEDEGFFGVRTRVGFVIYVWKPYPGRFAQISVHPTSVPVGENTQVRVIIHSRGDQPISGDLEIFIEDPDGRLIDKIVQPDIMVDGNIEIDRYAQILSADWEPGKYLVRARYDYGDEVAEAENELKLGTRTVLINNITRSFYKDQNPNQFTVFLESMWNEPIGPISAELFLGATSGGTPVTTVPAFQEKTVIGYWPTDRTLEEGEHTGLVRVTLPTGDVVEETFLVHLYNESAKPEEQEPAERKVELGLADIAFFVVLLALIVYFVVHILRKDKAR